MSIGEALVQAESSKTRRAVAQGCHHLCRCCALSALCVVLPDAHVRAHSVQCAIITDAHVEGRLKYHFALSPIDLVKFPMLTAYDSSYGRPTVLYRLVGPRRTRSEGEGEWMYQVADAGDAGAGVGRPAGEVPERQRAHRVFQERPHGGSWRQGCQ